MNDMRVALPNGGTWVVTAAGLEILVRQRALCPVGKEWTVLDQEAFAAFLARLHSNTPSIEEGQC